MARGRMISKSLSTSAKIAALYDRCPKMAEFCRALFPLMVAHADDHGRLPGDEFTVKVQIDPISPRKLPEFVAALHLMREAGLILWYQVDGRKVIEIVQFSKHQNLHGHEKRPGEYPAYKSADQAISRGLGEVGQNWAELGESGLLTEGKGTEGKGREQNRSGAGALELTTADDQRFSTFWQTYPKRKGKSHARQAFARLAVTDALLLSMQRAIAESVQSPEWLREGGRYIPHPATWLNQSRWEDEPVQIATVSEKTLKLISATEAFLRDA